MAKRATLTDFAAKKPTASSAAASPISPEIPATSKKQDERKGQTLRLSVEAWKQLKLLAVEEGTPVHDILVEAVNDAFRKRQKPPIA